MQFVCRNYGCKEVVPDKSLKVCPECGSTNTKTFLFGSKSITSKPEIQEEYVEGIEEDLTMQKEPFWSKRERSIGYTCLGFLIGLIGVPAAFLYVLFLLHEQGVDFPATGGEILIIIILGLVGAIVGALIGYFGSSGKKSRKGSTPHNIN